LRVFWEDGDKPTTTLATLMANRFETSFFFDGVERACANLSDSIADLVLPRSHRHTSSRSTLPTSLETVESDAAAVGTDAQNAVSTNSRASVKRLRATEEADTFEKGKTTRREKRRTNQARYRSRQRAHMLDLDQSEHQLHAELQHLELKREGLRLGQQQSYSTWMVVSEVFQLIATSFRLPWLVGDINTMMKHVEMRQSFVVLHRLFAHDVGMGHLNGLDALVNQLRRYSLHFDEPRMQLQCMEQVAPGVMVGTAKISLTVSDFTLRYVFPHLRKREGGNSYDDHRSLREQLLGRRLSCGCRVMFFMEEESNRVSRLEISIDLVQALRRLLSNVNDVERVLNGALLTQDGVIDDQKMKDEMGWSKQQQKCTRGFGLYHT
jgi:hypothetical protein